MFSYSHLDRHEIFVPRVDTSGGEGGGGFTPASIPAPRRGQTRRGAQVGVVPSSYQGVTERGDEGGLVCDIINLL